MKNIEKLFIFILISSLLFAGCEKNKEGNDPDQDKIGAAEDLLWLTPDLQPGTYRNIDKIFPTRVIKHGNNVFPLPYNATMLSSVVYSPDGINSYDIDDFIDRNNISGLLIIKDGKVALERYALGNNDDSKWVGFSTGKSFVSTLIGIAVQDGKIGSINDQVVEYLPQLEGSAYDGVSIKDLMQMSSGVSWNEDYMDPDSDISAIFQCILDGQSGGVINYMSQLPRLAEPGTRYIYSTGETHLEAELLNSVLQGESISDYLSRKIWANMGMEADGNWLLESENGIEFGGGLLSMTLRDYGRFGLFILNDGIINNEAILPVGWVNEAGTPPLDAPQCAYGELYSANNAGAYAYAYPLGYSYNWWPMPNQTWGSWDYLNDPLWWGSDAIDALPPNFTNLLGTFTAQGIFGQFIHINKDENMVAIVLSAWETPWIDPKEYETYCFLNAATDALKN